MRYKYKREDDNILHMFSTLEDAINYIKRTVDTFNKPKAELIYTKTKDNLWPYLSEDDILGCDDAGWIASMVWDRFIDDDRSPPRQFDYSHYSDDAEFPWDDPA